MEFNRRLYKNNPLHLYSYEINKNIFKVVIININKGFISNLVITYQNIDYSFEINSSDTVIELEENIISNNYVNEIPLIKEANINNQLCVLEYEREYQYIIQPKSIANMRDEKYLYIRKMVKYNGCKKENVKCNADQFKDYWHCTCGSVNLNCQEECINCHIDKEKLFSYEVDNSIEEAKTRRIVDSNKYILWMEVILLFIQFFIVDLSMKGDILFQNENLNTFIAVFNRFICPILFACFTIGLIFVRKRYLYKLEILLDLCRIILLIYLNLIVNISFVAHSYAFVIFIGFNLIFIGLYISQIILKVSKPHQVIALIMTICLLVSGVIQSSYYSKFDMKVTKDGITLTVHENVEELIVQNKINNVKVSKLVFEDNIDYSNIRKITINENLKYIVFPTPMVLSNLNDIELSTNNPYLYIENNILFYKGGHNVCLVPPSVEEITIDWETVEDFSFRECKNLKKVIFTEKVKTIGMNAFLNCEGLEEIIFESENNLLEIKETAFSGCKNLREIEIPNSVLKIGRGILSECSNIEKVSIPFVGEFRYETDDTFNQNVFAYTFGAGYNFDHINIPNLKEVIVTDQKFFQNATFYKCPAEKITILGGNLLKGAYLGQNAFYECKNLKEIVIPEGITEIRENCFINCVNLERIYLPSTLKVIKTNAFKGCESLKEVIFNDNSLKKIEIESGNECFFTLFHYFEK